MKYLYLALSYLVDGNGAQLALDWLASSGSLNLGVFCERIILSVQCLRTTCGTGPLVKSGAEGWWKILSVSLPS